MEKKLVLDENRQKFDEENYQKCYELEDQRFILYLEAWVWS